MSVEEVNPAVVSEPVVEEQLADDWAEAQDEFESTEETDQTEKKPVEAKPDSESHIEPEKVGVNLDDLKLPHKYKPFVKERIDKIVSEAETKFSAEREVAVKELGQHKEAVGGLVNIFKEIAQDPQKLVQYVQEYGEQIGLDQSVIEQYKGLQNQDVKREIPTETKNSQSVDAIFDKYAKPMLETQNPTEFYSLLKSQNLEVMNSVKQEMLGVIGNILQNYHEKFVAPDKKTLKEFKTKSDQSEAEVRVNSTISSWNKAADTVSGKYSDFKKYEPEIVKLLKDDPDFSEIRLKLNKEPKEVARREKLIERIYHMVAKQDHIASQKKPVRGALPPNSKHITTKKQGGNDWDEIYRDPDLGWQE